MYSFFVVLIIIAALLMIGIVLIQESKGGGLSSNFSASNQIMGVRKTTDVVEKATWGLAIAMVVLSVACAYVAPSAATDQSVLENVATEQQKTNPNTLPGFGASQSNESAAPAKDASAAGETQAPAQQTTPAQQPAQAPAQAPAQKPAK